MPVVNLIFWLLLLLPLCWVMIRSNQHVFMLLNPILNHFCFVTGHINFANWRHRLENSVLVFCLWWIAFYSSSMCSLSVEYTHTRPTINMLQNKTWFIRAWPLLHFSIGYFWYSLQCFWCFQTSLRCNSFTTRMWNWISSHLNMPLIK